MKKIFFLFLFISVYTFAQEKVKVDLRNPNATLYTHLYFLQEDSYNARNSARTIRGQTAKEAMVTAIKIKEVLDGKGLIVDFKDIPVAPNFLDTISGLHEGLSKAKHRFYPFPVKCRKFMLKKWEAYGIIPKKRLIILIKYIATPFPGSLPICKNVKRIPTGFQMLTPKTVFLNNSGNFFCR